MAQTGYYDDDNCQGAWLFDDDLTDESGEGNTLTDQGTITYSATVPNSIPDGKSTVYDGSSDYVDRPSDNGSVLSAHFPGMEQKTN